MREFNDYNPVKIRVSLPFCYKQIERKLKSRMTTSDHECPRVSTSKVTLINASGVIKMPIF